MISQESPDARFFAESIVREVVLMVSFLNRRSPNAQEKSVIQITLRPRCDLDHTSAFLGTCSFPPACAAALVAFHPFLMDGQSEDCPYAVPSGTAAITSLATPPAQPASEAAPGKSAQTTCKTRQLSGPTIARISQNLATQPDRQGSGDERNGTANRARRYRSRP
ncbi:MAG: hypothetical protein IPK50_11750 [Fibrobacterota bacterium]|nr:MAG: hypothetical protein IPK50_11750 [Fibrobacterota bacterium]